MSKSRRTRRARSSVSSIAPNRASYKRRNIYSLWLETLEDRCLLAVGDVVFRVNAGGAAIAGTPGWTADTNASPSPYRNSAAAPSGSFSTTSAINMTNASIPAGTPQALFQSERWDNAGGAEMSWGFPVTPGQYEVRLYLAEIYSGAFLVGGRTFSVQIEGATVLSNYDTYAEVGANAGVVKKFTVGSDATLNINFLHGVEDPAVKAIEIVVAGAVTPGALSSSASSLSFGSVIVGAAGQQSITLTNSGAAGAPSITVSGTTITGTNANQFSDSFNDATPVVLAPGQSTAITVNFNPTSSGAKTASLQIAHNGSSSPLVISLTGTGATAPTGGIVYRVNAGGPAIAGTPNWTADTDAVPVTTMPVTSRSVMLGFGVPLSS